MRVVVEVVLGDRGQPHQQRTSERHVPALDRALDETRGRVEVAPHVVHRASEGQRSFVRGIGTRVQPDSAQAHGQGLVGATNPFGEQLGQLGERGARLRGVAGALHLGFEDPNESLVVSARAKRSFQALLFEVPLGCRFQGALENLAAPLRLPLSLGDRAELEEHLAASDPGRPHGFLAASKHDQERAVALLGALELPVVPSELRERA